MDSATLMQVPPDYLKLIKAIELILSSTPQVCGYFIFTNDDNLYASGFLDNYIKPDIEANIDIIGFDFISHYKT